MMLTSNSDVVPSLDADLRSDDCAAAEALAAASEGRSNSLQLLLDSSSARSLAQLLDARDAEQRTPLILAASRGHAECVRLLLQYNPDVQVQAKDAKGRTALMHAARHHPACVRLLLEHSPEAQVAARDNKQMNTLMSTIISASRNPTTVALLLAHSPHMQLEHVAAGGCNALIVTALIDDASCMRLLLAYSPHVQVSAVMNSNNALMYAAMLSHTDCMRLLLAHSPGVQMAATSDKGVGALDEAASRGHVDCLRLHLVHSPSPEQLDKALLGTAQEMARHCPADQERSQGLRRCMELLLADGAVLTSAAGASAGAVAAVRSVSKDLAARALVPDMANEAVVGLVLAAAGGRNWRSSSEGAAASCS